MLALYLATVLAAPEVDPGSSVEPITLAEAKKHLRVDSSADNALIEDAIVSAREWVEGYTGVLLTRRTVTERISAFADHTKLRAWPIAAGLPLTLVYRDTADDEDAGQTLLRTAGADATSTLYSFEVTLADGAKRYFEGRVFGYPESVDGADTILMATPTIEIDTAVVKVAAP